MVDSIYALKYIGSKRRMAGALTSLIPASCTVYVEPYCGSAALALNSRSTFQKKVLNDKNPHMSNFWRVAASPQLSPRLMEQLSATTYSRALFQEAKNRREDFGANRTDLVAWAVDTYILNWQSFNALGDSWRYIDPNSYLNRFSNNVLGLQAVLTVLGKQNIEVYNKNAIDLLQEGKYLEDDKVFIFLDPPYLEGLRSDGKLYQTDMPDVRDHIELLSNIQRAKAKIVLSGYWSGWDDGSDLYDCYLLPNGWHRHLLGEYAKSCGNGADSKSRGAEWIWCNYDLVKEAPASLVNLESFNDEQKSPCLKAWLAVHSTPRKGGEVA